MVSSDGFSLALTMVDDKVNALSSKVLSKLCIVVWYMSVLCKGNCLPIKHNLQASLYCKY